MILHIKNFSTELSAAPVIGPLVSPDWITSKKGSSNATASMSLAAPVAARRDLSSLKPTINGLSYENSITEGQIKHVLESHNHPKTMNKRTSMA